MKRSPGDVWTEGMAAPCRGEIWRAGLPSKDATTGHRQAGPRPVVVISHDAFNKGVYSCIVALTITKQKKRHRMPRSYIPIAASPTNGLKLDSLIICDQPQTIDYRQQANGVIDISDIVPDPVQPPGKFNSQYIEDTTRNILANGQQKAISVRASPIPEKWYVVKNEHIYLACVKAGVKDVWIEDDERKAVPLEYWGEIEAAIMKDVEFWLYTVLGLAMPP